MQIQKINGDMCNVYLIKSNINILVDAGASLDEILQFVDKIDYIFITHAHFDHIYYLNDYCNQFKNCKILISENGVNKLTDNHLNCALKHDIPLNVRIDKDRLIYKKENEKIDNLENHNTIIELKGHTDCCLGLIIENNLFCGDAIFFDGIGRYDLPTSDFSETKKTIRKIRNLENIDFIYSGHGLSPFNLKK